MARSPLGSRPRAGGRACCRGPGPAAAEGTARCAEQGRGRALRSEGSPLAGRMPCVPWRPRQGRRGGSEVQHRHVQLNSFWP